MQIYKNRLYINTYVKLNQYSICVNKKWKKSRFANEDKVRCKDEKINAKVSILEDVVVW